ncbi:hypothetical protein DXG01_011860 [Tephrocybe rancida]|nr:hypothetical protein DXG01_011860 [Tephrocybe rancida]
MSNFLPNPTDPEYPARLESLSDYRESLQVRYPPVCDNCSPAVEDQIRQKDHMARTQALGAWLNDSKGKERQRRVSEGYQEPEKPTTDVLIWRLRGVLWAVTLVCAMMFNLAGVLAIQSLYPLTTLQPILPGVILISLLWTAWDPTYTSLQRARRQGRDVRVRGKDRYITFIVSCKVIRLHQPPAVRLLNTNAHKTSLSRSETPHLATRESTPSIGLGHPSTIRDPDFLAALSLSSKPVMTPTNPVFGLPSLLAATTPTNSNRGHDVNEMDWTPTDTSESQAPRQADDASYLRPQKFFAPEKATGLEGLFERTLLVVDDTPLVSDDKNSRNLVWRHLQTWWWAYIVFLVPIGAVVYQLQERSRTWSRPLGPEPFSA